MQVKDLIKELLDYNMESEVKLLIKYADIDDEIEEFSIEPVSSDFGRDKVMVSVNFESTTYHERIQFEEE